MSIAVPARTAAPRTAEPDPLADSLWVSLHYLSISRLLIAGVLALLVPLSQGQDAVASGFDRPLFQAVALVYLLLSAAFLAAIEPLRPRFQLQLLAQVLVDLVALSLLIHAGGGLRNGFGVLLIAPVAGAAILSTPLRAGFFAAVAAILLLAQAGARALSDASSGGAEFVQAGLTGAACFAAALLVNRLAQRLGAQEALARRRGEDLRSQLAINQLVIADLPDGVVVMSRSGEARTMNRSARALLGNVAAATRASGATARAPGLLWSRVAAEHAAWRGAGCPPGRAVDLPLDEGPGGGAARAGAPPRRVRLRFLGPPQVDGDCVVLVEDLDRVDERAQQLKLASMGRLSASIAHEIRNPLGAIRHANGLLAERLHDPQQRRLAAIVEDNSVRINRVVEHVLSIARRERAATEPIDMAAFLDAFVGEYILQHDVEAARVALSVDALEPLPFDREHLRQVLVNLVGNALRYASPAAGAVRIAWRAAGGDRLELSIADDGPGLSTEQAQHVFEPFFTTESRGTGLGLYLVRELCGSNGAAIRYERFASVSPHSGAFVISIQRAER